MAAVTVTLLAIQLNAQPNAESGASGLQNLRSIRNALIRAGDFSAALGPAGDIVTRLEPLNDPALPDDIVWLARIQARLDMLEDAEQNYLKATKMIQDSEGEFSPRLIQPYQGLGRTYIKARKFPEAISVLEQARHVSQRKWGLFNLNQSALIDDQTTAELGIGDTVTARDLQQERLEDAVKELGAEDPRVLPYYYHLADYYERSRLRVSAREQYQAAAALLDKQSDSDPRLLAPLRAMTQIDMQLGQGKEAHERLVDVLTSNPDYDARERSLSLAVLGDWDLLQDDPGAAREHYLQAYQILAAAEPDAADAQFSTPRMIDFVPPLNAVDRAERRRPYSWGEIVLRFDVSPEGRALNVETASVKPANRVAGEYDRRIRETHFRPSLAAGVPVTAEDVQFRHYFRYYLQKKK